MFECRTNGIVNASQQFSVQWRVWHCGLGCLVENPILGATEEERNILAKSKRCIDLRHRSGKAKTCQWLGETAIDLISLESVVLFACNVSNHISDYHFYLTNYYNVHIYTDEEEYLGVVILVDAVNAREIRW